ncbi:MAG: tetratricopeptide repeat protein [Mucilaginibacter sp.]|uniref:tetratricopeptide repeat protein n=1 Tax=Mucilaginibacter sp. TaxID=1882438 RepID=UPI0032643F49
MKKYFIVMVLVLSASAIYAQKEKADIRKGNQLYQDKKYKEAEEAYKNGVAKKDQSVEGNFNMGDAQFRQKNFKDAQTQFTKIAETANNKNVAASAYHNLGNSLLQSQKLEESIDAYKKALMNNPKDDQTRYNLAYAQKKLQDKKDQDKKDKKDNKDNKDKKDQDKKDQNKDNKDNKDKDKKDQDKKDQDKKDQDKKDQDKKDQQGQQPNKVSKDDAERMLEALNNQEKQTQDKLKNKKLKGAKVAISKDW